MDAPRGLVSGAQTLKDDKGVSKKLNRKISQEKLIEEKLETNKKLMNIMHKIQKMKKSDEMLVADPRRQIDSVDLQKPTAQKLEDLDISMTPDQTVTSDNSLQLAKPKKNRNLMN